MENENRGNGGIQQYLCLAFPGRKVTEAEWANINIPSLCKMIHIQCRKVLTAQEGTNLDIEKS